jgi:1,4-alpha-glucan branching enzyme
MTESQKKTNASERTKGASTKEVGAKPEMKASAVMGTGIKKQHMRREGFCRVTFRLPSVAAKDATNVCIVGDFNNWNIRANPMKKMKNGDYTITLDLKPGKDYQFRYLIDEAKWENDWNADKYVKNPYGDSDNSVVVV